jgi:hypothetical protein
MLYVLEKFEDGAWKQIGLSSDKDEAVAAMRFMQKNAPGSYRVRADQITL